MGKLVPLVGRGVGLGVGIPVGSNKQMENDEGSAIFTNKMHFQSSFLLVVGRTVGIVVGREMGTMVGMEVGESVGTLEGADDGCPVGS